MEATSKAHEEQEGRHGQLLAALRTEFLAAQERWQKASAAIEELTVQMEAIRAARAVGTAGALLDPRHLDKPQKFHGKQAEWKDWNESFTSFVEVVDEKLADELTSAYAYVRAHVPAKPLGNTAADRPVDDIKAVLGQGTTATAVTSGSLSMIQLEASAVNTLGTSRIRHVLTCA